MAGSEGEPLFFNYLRDMLTCKAAEYYSMILYRC